MSRACGFQAVVLAAGAARRFGGGKLLHPLGGRPLIHHALDAAVRAPVKGVVVAVGADRDAVKAAVDAYPLAASAPQLRVVGVNDWEEGLAASLRTAIAALPPCEGAFVFLADMPAIPASILAPLANAVSRGALAAAPVFRGRPGHPVVIGAALFPQVSALRGDRGARSILDGLGPALFTLETDDPGVTLDVDRPADLSDLAGSQDGLRSAIM